MSIFERTKEKQKQEREERRQKMSTLCAQLETSLSPDGGIPDHNLSRQAHILEELLYAVLKSNIDTDIQKGYFNTQGIELALRIQKQCADTVKTAAAIDYMNMLNARHGAIIPSPPPMKISERTDNSDIDNAP